MIHVRRTNRARANLNRPTTGRGSADVVWISYQQLWIAFYIVALIVASPTTSRSQSIEGVRSQIRLREVQESGEYRWGEGYGESVEEAKSNARCVDPAGRRIFIHTEGKRTTQETTTDLTEEWTKSSRLVASMQLQGLDYLDLGETNDQYHFLAYISKENLARVTLRQKQRIREQVALAMRAEAEANLDDALRQYYWAYLLTHTIMDTLALPLPGGVATSPGSALYEHMHSMIKNIQIQADPCQPESGMFGVTIRVSYEGKPVRSLDFVYYAGDGNDFAHISDGFGYLEYFTDPEAIEFRDQTRKLQVRYAYEGLMGHSLDLQELYAALRDKAIDSWVEVRLEFPWVNQKHQQLPKLKSVTPTEEVKVWPVPVLVLADQTTTADFLEVLTALKKYDRILVHKTRPISAGELFVGILDGEKVRGVYHIEVQGIRDVRKGKRYPDLQQPEFDGASVIWMELVQ